MTLDWLTNDPQIAAQLRAADHAYDSARKAAEHLPLAQKVKAYGQATLDRANAYADIHRQITAR